MRIALALAAISLVSAVPPVHAELIWRYVPQHGFAIGTAPIFADLDGDGVGEIVFIAASSQLWGQTNGIGVLRDGADGFAQVELHAIPGKVDGLAAVPADGGAQTLLVSLREDSVSEDRLVELTGLPLRQLRTFNSTTAVRPSFVGDVDADGDDEIVGLSNFSSFTWNAPAVYDYLTGDQRWTGLEGSSSASVAQLDQDPALEVIAGGFPGVIHDGATGAEEWTYPSGFSGVVLAGQFEADAEVPTFATVGKTLRIFRGQPYSPVREFPLSSEANIAAAFDMDDDGLDEVLIASFAPSPLTLIEPLDGSITSIALPWYSSHSFGVGRSEPGGPVLIARGGTSDSSSQIDEVQVLAYPSQGELFRGRVEAGPFQTAGFGDLNADGETEALLISGREASVSPWQIQAAITVFDSTGERVAERLDIGTALQSQGERRLHLADLDGVAGDEIIFANTSSYESVLAVLDGTTLDDRWRVLGTVEHPLGEVMAIGNADFDADGLDDIIALSKSNSVARLLVFSGIDGTLLWTSVGLKDSGFSIEPNMMLHNVDDDPLDEVLVGVGRGVYAFDIATRLLDWAYSLPPGEQVTALMAWGSGVDCQLGIVFGAPTISIHRCADRARVNMIDLPYEVSTIVPLDDRGEQFALTVNGQLWTVRSGSPAQLFSDEFMGRDLGGMPAIATTTAADGSIDILLGSDAHLSRIRVIEGRIFSDGFEVEQ